MMNSQGSTGREATGAERLVEAFRRQGVRVEAPFTFSGSDGTFTTAAYLPDFGGPNGMVVRLCNFDRASPEEKSLESAFGRTAKACGYYLSILNETARLDDDTVRATLDDWGYFGPTELRPAWYTGKPWC